jgi:aspartyl-tRNA(Asn)/glutamyl-tRNA(Gln) amidotransferase subunit B
MEQGRLRCDVNISVRKWGEEKLGTKVEIKNLNSIRFIRKAIEVERERLITLLENGGTVIQQTRGYDEVTNTTYAIRTKEDADDYRYFADPDLPPFSISDEMIESIRQAMPPSRKQRLEALVSQFSLSEYDASALAADTGLETFFRSIVQHTAYTKAAANWVLNPIRNRLAEAELTSEEINIAPEAIATLIDLIEQKKTTHGMAVQKVLPALFENGSLDVAQYLENNNLLLGDNNGEVESWIQAVLDKHPQKVAEFKKGKKGLIGFFVGEAMRLARGKADAKLITDKFSEKLKQ